MAERLGPIDVCCDAPPYPIVRACREVGIQDAEDVRWCRLSHFLGQRHGWIETLVGRPWKGLLGGGEDDARRCSCGQTFPRLSTVLFLLHTGEELTYRLGQCRRCWTVFWDQA